MNKGICFASFTAILWGFLAIGLKVAVAILDPLTITWFRFALAFSVLVIYYLITDTKKLKLLLRPPVMTDHINIRVVNYQMFIFVLWK